MSAAAVVPDLPGRGRLFGAAVGREAREDKAGDKQMGADPPLRRVTQFVLQRFGKGLHAGFRHIVGGIAGRRRDALLGAGVDDEPGPPARDHAGGEHLRTVNDAPEVDGENVLPVL